MPLKCAASNLLSQSHAGGGYCDQADMDDELPKKTKGRKKIKPTSNIGRTSRSANGGADSSPRKTTKSHERQQHSKSRLIVQNHDDLVNTDNEPLSNKNTKKYRHQNFDPDAPMAPMDGEQFKPAGPDGGLVVESADADQTLQLEIKIGSRVLVEWKNKSYKATVKKIHKTKPKFKVHYDGFRASETDWVLSDKVSFYNEKEVQKRVDAFKMKIRGKFDNSQEGAISVVGKRNQRHPVQRNGECSKKPYHKKGDRVYALWNGQNIDQSTSCINTSWYPGVVSKAHLSRNCSQYGPIATYDIDFDDGDENEKVEEVFVMKEDDYLLSLRKGPGQWNGVECMCCKDSNDEYISLIGWYEVLINGQSHVFSSLAVAIRAHDDHKVSVKGSKTRHTDINLPEEWEFYFPHGTETPKRLSTIGTQTLSSNEKEPQRIQVAPVVSSDLEFHFSTGAVDIEPLDSKEKGGAPSAAPVNSSTPEIDSSTVATGGLGRKEPPIGKENASVNTSDVSFEKRNPDNGGRTSRSSYGGTDSNDSDDDGFYPHESEPSNEEDSLTNLVVPPRRTLTLKKLDRKDKEEAPSIAPVNSSTPKVNSSTVAIGELGSNYSLLDREKSMIDMSTISIERRNTDNACGGDGRLNGAEISDLERPNKRQKRNLTSAPIFQVNGLPRRTITLAFEEWSSDIPFCKDHYTHGDVVFAHLPSCEADNYDDYSCLWQRCTILDYKVEKEGGRYGPIYKYDVKLDSGERRHDIKEICVVSEEDYRLLSKNYPNGIQWMGIENVCAPDESDDVFAKECGWYEAFTAEPRSKFSSLAEAGQAYDKFIVDSIGEETHENDLNLPEKWKFVYPSGLSAPTLWKNVVGTSAGSPTEDSSSQAKD